MTAGLSSYPAYRDSGVAWLGEVPVHWEKKRGKFFLHEVDERSIDGSELLLSVSHITGVTPRKASVTMFMSESTEGYKICRPGDLVINTMWAWMGALGLSKHVGLVSPSYGVYRLQTNELFDSNYLDRLFRTHSYTSEYLCRSTGIRSSRLRLYPEVFLDIPVIRPPLEEQWAIVRFLDHADSRIRRAVSTKRRLIALLTEEKQAVIHRAVTRGLDPDVPLKPSGVEWLGDVPAHWEVMLNQRLLKEEVRPHGDQPEMQLSLSQRDGLIPTDTMQERSLQTSSFDNWKVTIPGDLVLNRFKAHLGVFFASTLRGIVSFHYGVFSPRNPVVTKYFELLYHTNVYRAIYAGRSNGMTVGLQNLSNQSFYNVRSIVPPLHEQAAIVSYVEKMAERFDNEINSANREISLLLEFRTRLIADVVTGKRDVREAAAGLPDEVDELAMLDELEVPDEDGREMEEE